MSRSRWRILLVDDDAIIRRTLASNLMNDDFEVLTAGSGPEALTLVETTWPDMAVLDLMMPGMSGFEVADRASAGGVTLQVEVPPDAPPLVADPQAVRQILTNLIDNALRYTPAGGRVSIASRHDHRDTVIEVRDTGSGIPAEHLPRLFERFYRVDASRSRTEGGTGLGLAIVRHLVEAHGGAVRAESMVGQGTTITVHFPARPVTHA